MARKNPVTGAEACRHCNGRGELPFGTEIVKCDACKGTGKVRGGAKKSPPKDRG
jgi:DnaJ-class molecular chaperone